MRADDVTRWLRRRPFEPFRIRLTDGQVFDIRHPELLLLGKRWLTLGLVDNPADTVADRALDLARIVTIESIPAATPPGGNGG